ncbi:MAG: phospholipase [Bacillota bacterium]|nr:phospholipase [Bacillota bacterium]
MEQRYYKFDHSHLTWQGIAILAADGQKEAELLLPPPRGLRLGEAAVKGAAAADGRVGVFFHFHHPYKHQGFAGSRVSSASVAEFEFRRARRLWYKGRKEAALYRLGLVCHLLQDAYVPHHAGLMGAFLPLGLDPYGHAAYESWLREKEHWREFSVESGGEYTWHGSHGHPRYGTHFTTSDRVYDWIDDAAATAFRLLPRVDKSVNPSYRENWPEVARVLIPCTLRRTAGLIHHFFQTVAGTKKTA